LGAAGYLRSPATGLERVLAVAGGVLLLMVEPRLAAAGLACVVVALALHIRRRP
jgi:hypothetical protein